MGWTEWKNAGNELIKVADVPRGTSAQEIDCSGLQNYQLLTKDDFLLVIDKVTTQFSVAVNSVMTFTPTITAYDATTGILTTSKTWYLNSGSYGVSIYSSLYVKQ